MDFMGPGRVPEPPWDASRIITLRRGLSFDQEEFARRLHVRLRTLQLWEDGHGEAAPVARPYLDRMEKQLGQSQEMALARKKSAVVPDDTDAEGSDQTEEKRVNPVSMQQRLARLNQMLADKAHRSSVT